MTMRAASCFSGIGAKACARCKASKAESAFQRRGDKLQSWCRECMNEYRREKGYRGRKPPAEQKRAWQIKTRYGLTPADVDRMVAEQGGVCAICTGPMERPCIDHCHTTGKVRGILCHRCNVRLSAIDDLAYRTAAIAYLERS
ncbi:MULTISPECIES: endonuclease domain-containing protein [unclassified Blastomonas]|uniref:endonuclease domain-containing protein n=2 Tax=Blastomonas TaxID=150203 RepID=UPI0009EC6FD0|nr:MULTISPECIES: endonuclease domain-containing protein [unclassified Blastomonas]